MFQIGTNKTERFLFMTLLNLINTLDRLFVHDIATDPIECIGWIGNNTPFFQMFGNASDKPLLGIDGIDLEQHDPPCA
jgi:hypothetical protein